VAKICRVIRIKLNQLVEENVRIIAILLRKWCRIRNISQSLTYNMAEKQLA